MANPYDIYSTYGTNIGDSYGAGTLTPTLFGQGTPASATAAQNATPASVSPYADSWATPGGLNLRQTTNGGILPPGSDKSTDFQFGFNPGTINLALGGLATISNVWNAWQANKLAKEQLGLQRKATNINLANQIMAYNTTLEDRIANRVESGGWTPERGSSWISSHKLADAKI